MHDFIINLFANFPKEISTMLIAMTPVAELRVSIPVAILKFEMSPWLAFFWSVLGNTMMGIIVVLIIEPVTRLIINKVGFFRKLWMRYIYKIETKNSAKFNKWGSIILVSFIAIPLPMTGVFTGAVAASIFQIPIWRAAPLLLAGSSAAGVIVTGITLLF